MSAAPLPHDTPPRDTLPRDTLVVFAKAPIPGQVKTRLARHVGDRAAADLAAAFLLDTVDRARASGARVLLAFDPPEEEPWFREHAGSASLSPQPDLDFGARVLAALRAARAEGAGRVVVVGMDSPHVPAERWSEAFAALEDRDLCLGPSEDGGYYLLGLREPRAELFDGIPWGTAGVLDATRARAAALGLSVTELATDFDVDEEADLQRLAEVLAARPGECPRTRAALEARGLL